MNSNDRPTTCVENPALLPEPATPNLESPTPFAYRGNGKIARLPKPIRDQINHWMLDGLSYPDIATFSRGPQITPHASVNVGARSGILQSSFCILHLNSCR